jgi:hypothetical protein
MRKTNLEEFKGPRETVDPTPDQSRQQSSRKSYDKKRITAGIPQEGEEEASPKRTPTDIPLRL